MSRRQEDTACSLSRGVSSCDPRMKIQRIMDDVDDLGLEDLLKQSWGWLGAVRADFEDGRENNIESGWLVMVEGQLQAIADRQAVREIEGQKPFARFGRRARERLAQERIDKQQIADFLERESWRR